jgi:hypothetical protein
MFFLYSFWHENQRQTTFLQAKRNYQVGKQMEIIREEAADKVKSSSLDYYMNQLGNGGGGRGRGGAAITPFPPHTHRKTLNKYCKDDFAFVS